MGGPIAVTIRFSDTDIDSFEAWTNPTSYWFKHFDMVDKPEEHFKTYSDPKRWEKGYPKTQLPVAPWGYGLVFIDVSSRRLLNMQSYTSYDHFYLSSLVMEASQAVEDPETRDYSPKRMQRLVKHGPSKRIVDSGAEQLEQFYKFCLAGRIKSAQNYNREKGELEQLAGFEPQKTWQLLCQILENELSDKKDHSMTLTGLRFFHDVGFAVERFTENSAGLKMFHDEVAKLVKLSPEDEAAWAEFNKRWSDDEEEDADQD